LKEGLAVWRSVLMLLPSFLDGTHTPACSYAILRHDNKRSELAIGDSDLTFSDVRTGKGCGFSCWQ